MITLTINPQDARTLIDLIDCCLDDLRVEIRHTANVDYKDNLKHRRESLQELREKLNVSQPEVPEPAF